VTASRRGYLNVFAALVVLTAAELAIVWVPGIARSALILGLIVLAVAKAALVLLFFMHLGGETRVLKATVIGPLLLPALYALVLVGDAVWRLAT
jgi:cytochrome c oxidase subunit IV